MTREALLTLIPGGQ